MLDMAPPQELVWMSAREDFWNAEQISDQTYLMSTTPVDFSQFAGKQVLLLIHGYNNSAEDARNTYTTLFNSIGELKGADGRPLYDTVIGYFWPGYDNVALYSRAKENVESPKLKNQLRTTLTELAASASACDVLAHSMGNRLLLEALSNAVDATRPLVRYFYSFAAAIDDDSIEKDKSYGAAIGLCQTAYIFHSDTDIALNGYRVGEHHEALGADEKIELAQMPSNVQFIDCTYFLRGDHSGYFTKAAKPLYQFIQNQRVAPTLTEAPQEWRLLETGAVEPGNVVLSRLEKFKYLAEGAAYRLVP